jgi:hypothetical protein
MLWPCATTASESLCRYEKGAAKGSWNPSRVTWKADTSAPGEVHPLGTIATSDVGARWTSHNTANAKSGMTLTELRATDECMADA